jgi:glycosyltransferase involved in cell wall biosynthesis
MNLSVLNVAYPFAPVTADPVGGAEQVLSMLDRAVIAAGGRSVVLAAEGSSPAGELEPIAQPEGAIDAAGREAVHAALRVQLDAAIDRVRPDVVHLHGIDFSHYLPADGPPALVTLHLPLDWYPASALAPLRSRTWLTPVSRDQARRRPTGARLTRPIENGVCLEAFTPRRKHDYAVALGRICPEKGFHHALDAARAADMPLLLAGSVFPYTDHIRYFEREIRPRLDRRRRWIGPVSGRAKRRLLGSARCLIAPSLAPETSSLVAREALAAGAPVVALRSGALVDVVEPGRTGILVEAPEALPEALVAAASLDPRECRRAAERRFSDRTMIASYLAVYATLAAGGELSLMTGADARVGLPLGA